MQKLIGLLTLTLAIGANAAMAQNVTHEFTLNPETASTVVKIKNPSVVAEPVNQNATEVYMTLDNTGHQNHQVVAATSPSSEIVQLHQMYSKNGKMFMHQIPDVLIPAHGDKVLEGHFHVMLIDTHKRLTPGQVVPVTLIFKDGSWLAFNAKVKDETQP